jgi:hypothetical protein
MLYKKKSLICYLNQRLEIDDDTIKFNDYSRKYELNKLIIINDFGIYITNESVIIDNIRNFKYDYKYPFVIGWDTVIICNGIVHTNPAKNHIYFYLNFILYHSENGNYALINYKTNQNLLLRKFNYEIYQDSFGNAYFKYQSNNNPTNLIKFKSSHLDVFNQLDGRLYDYLISKLTRKIHELKGEDSGRII